jgi:hypothetical protein
MGEGGIGRNLPNGDLRLLFASLKPPTRRKIQQWPDDIGAFCPAFHYHYREISLDLVHGTRLISISGVVWSSRDFEFIT